MSLIGQMTTGDGIVTVLGGRSHADEFIVIGDVDTANPLEGLNVEIDGVTYINVVDNAAIIQAYAQWMMKRTGAAGSTLPGLVIKVATGNVPQSTTYRFTNAGATTPNIYAFSDNDVGVPFMLGTKTINASSYLDFKKFSALFIGTPANVSSVEIVFKSGRKETMTMQEVGALFAMQQDSEANGYLAGVGVIDNTKQTIKSVRVYCTADTVMAIAKIPDAAFQVLRSGG